MKVSRNLLLVALVGLTEAKPCSKVTRSSSLVSTTTTTVPSSYVPYSTLSSTPCLTSSLSASSATSSSSTSETSSASLSETSSSSSSWTSSSASSETSLTVSESSSPTVPETSSSATSSGTSSSATSSETSSSATSSETSSSATSSETSSSTTASETSSSATSSETISPTSSSANSSTTPTPTDVCLEALQTQGDVAVADCSSRLVTTVTPFPVIITEVTTVTSIVSTLDSTFFTETTTTTGTTETSLFTSVEIVTATATSTAVAQTTTVATSTSTSVVRGPTTTTWNFGPTAVLARGIEARQTLTALPDYAAVACESEEQYESACSVIGVQSTTITAPTPTITAINTIIEPLTTTWTTVSSTQTDVAVVTATEFTTTITTSTATITTVATSTNTQTSTSIVRTTTTSTTTIENLCRPTGTRFRLPVVIPGAGPGQRNYLSISSNGQIIAQNLPANPSAEQRRRSSFEITRDRSLQGMWGILIPWVSSYSTSPAPGATVLLQLNTQGTTDLNVALGRARNVFTCIDRTTNVVRLFDGLGRQNLAVCGQSNQLAISSGDGSDRATCKPVTVTAEIL